MLKTQDQLSRFCMVQQGGSRAGSIRVQMPARYVYWLSSTPPIVAMLGKLAGATPTVIAKAVIADTVIITGGAWPCQSRKWTRSHNDVDARFIGLPVIIKLWQFEQSKLP